MIEFLSFDESKTSPDLYSIMFYTALIILTTQIVFVVVAKIMGIDDVEQDLDDEKQKEYSQWKKKGVTPFQVGMGELFNSTIYSPISEEFLFRIVLMKYICVERLKLTPLAANVIQASIFGGMHLTNVAFSNQTGKYTKLQTLSATIAGLISGWTFIQSNSILPSLIAHALNNASAGISELLGYMKFLDGGDVIDDGCDEKLSKLRDTLSDTLYEIIYNSSALEICRESTNDTKNEFIQCMTDKCKDMDRTPEKLAFCTRPDNTNDPLCDGMEQEMGTATKECSGICTGDV